MLVINPCSLTKSLPFPGVKWPQICSLLVARITSLLLIISQILWKSLNLKTPPHMLSWEFNHVTASPHHPKSNGKAESSVKVVKLLFKKAKHEGKDPWLALLDYRNTPTEGIGASLAQRLMSCRTQSLLPTASSLLRPEASAHSTERLEWKRRKVKFYHDRHSKQLPELEIGQVRKNCTLAKEPNMEASDLCRETLR